MTEEVAGACLTMASLLRAGNTPAHALKLLAGDGGKTSAALRDASQRVAEGETPGQAIAALQSEAWKVVACALAIAERSGAPLAPTLERVSAALSRLHTATRKRAVLLASPRATVLLLSALPLITLVIAEGLGVRVVHELMAPAGLIIAAVGALLLTIGVSWALAMVSRVREGERLGGLELELLWVGLAGGIGPVAARRLVVHTADLFHASWVNLESFARDGEATQLIKTSQHTGSSLAALLERRAAAQQEAQEHTLEARAEELSVRILIPIGLFVLPSFVCLGITPIFLALMR